MFSLIITIARTTFLESVRQPVYFLMIALCGLFQVINTASLGYSLGYGDSSEVSGDNKLLLDVGLATVLFCGTLLAGFVATAALSREIEKKTVLTVVSKPVPRPVVVIGKYVGAAAALLIATLTMIIFLHIGLRHGIMSTARDEIDIPVVLFGFGAVTLALGIGVWGNFFYGWHFTQTASLLLFPFIIIAWVLVLLVNKNGQLQPISRDFKFQIFVASMCLPLAILVLTAVATAASARLGQVMTIVLCFGVFVMGLLSNYFLGRRAFINQPVGQIALATPEKPQMESFLSFGDIYQVVLKTAPTGASSTGGFAPGKPFYYGPNPNGFDMAVPAFEPFTGDVNDAETMFKQGTPGALAVMASNGRRLTVRNVGAIPLAVDRPPRTGDFVFSGATRINPVAAVAWGIIPNMQIFWLTDAVTQNRPVPAMHFLKIAGYSSAQIVAFLALAVILFQRREVG